MAQKWRAVSVNNKLIVVFSGVTMLATVVYSVVAAWTLREIHTGASDTHTLALAAKKQADLAWLNTENTQAASFKINEIAPVGDGRWRVFTVNFGKAIAPTFDLNYSIVHQSFPDGRIIDENGPFAIHRANVLPSDPTKGTDVVFDFQTRGYSPQDKRLTSAEETFTIKGGFSYTNGFNRKVDEPFCWETYPVTPSQINWDSCLTAKSALSNARRNNTSNTPQPQTKPN